MPADHRRLDELIGSHLDGRLGDDETRELARLLAADREARQRFARSLALDTVLPRAVRRRNPLLRWWPAMAAAATLVAGLGLWLAAGDDGAGPVLEPGGRVVVARAGIDLAEPPRGRLHLGDIVRPIEGPATLAWPEESTRTVLQAGSVLELAGAGPAKDLVLRSGQMAVEAGRQDGDRRLSVRAGRITASVVGTRFRVAAGEGSSSVAVEQGSVSIAAGTERHTVGAGQLVVAAGTAPVWVSRPGDEVGQMLAASAGAHLDAAAWTADRGRDWTGTVRDGRLVAQVEATAERIQNPMRLDDGYARLLPDLAITADLSLSRPGTLAIFLICRRPDGRDWIGNYTVKQDLQPGRHRLAWSYADLGIEKGVPIADALGARIASVAVCAWQPAGLTIASVTVGNAAAVRR